MVKCAITPIAAANRVHASAMYTSATCFLTSSVSGLFLVAAEGSWLLLPHVGKENAGVAGVVIPLRLVASEVL